MNELRTRLLQSIPIFGGIRREVIELLLSRSSVVEVAAGEVFFEEGARGTSGFVLESGRVSILKSCDDREYLLHRLDPGDCFGEVALIDFGSRSATVRADEDCSAIQFTASDLLIVGKEDPQEFALIYMNLARELARRLRNADERLLRAKVAGDSIAADYAFTLG